MKLCRDCGQTKDIIDFGWRTGSDMVRAYCKPCMVKRTRAWQEANHERWNAYQRAYRKNANSSH
jgi:hypothetical protein